MRMSQPQLAVSRNQPDPSASPDVILPSQFYNNAGDRALISEQRLMLAVLADAINILQNWRVAAGIRKRQLYVEAEQWVFGSRQQRPFSFEYVCDALGMD